MQKQVLLNSKKIDVTQSVVGQYRWNIVALLFFATTINYLDRQVISLLKPILEKEFHWTESDYSNIVIFFQAMYALGLIFVGRFIDKVGTKLGYSISVLFWSVAAMAHAFAKSTFGFGMARAALGLGEAGNYPAAVKTVAEWFPKKERAFATGLFNSGSTIGAIVAPASVPFIAIQYGWQWAFIITGALGFIWLFFWWRIYEEPSRHKKLSSSELNYINSDDETLSKENIPWLSLLKVKATWGFAIGKFLTDSVWYFYLFWLPSYLTNQGLTMSKISLPIIIVYTLASLGSIGGGWLSSKFIKMGLSINKSRKITMLFFALMAFQVIWINYSDDLWLSIFVISLAAAAHTGWSANIFTMVSDQFPKSAISTVVGIGSMAGAVGGILFAKGTGLLLDHFKAISNLQAGYNILFTVCSLAYLISLLIIHVLSPKSETITFMRIKG